MKEIKNAVSEVIEMDSYRAKKAEESRRRFERLFISREVSAYLQFAGQKQVPIEINELSEVGLSFVLGRAWTSAAEFGPSAAVVIRLFLTPATSIDLPATLIRQRSAESGHEFGCEFKMNSPCYEVYVAWIQFLRTYARFGSVWKADPGVA